MKTIDKYVKFKSQYKDYVVLIKSGNFYYSFGEDAYILKYFFNSSLLSLTVKSSILNDIAIIINASNIKITNKFLDKLCEQFKLNVPALKGLDDFGEINLGLNVDDNGLKNVYLDFKHWNDFIKDTPTYVKKIRFKKIITINLTNTFIAKNMSKMVSNWKKISFFILFV